MERPILAESKCRICLGPIREGQFRISCSCGNEFHETCASKIVDCPLCNSPLQSIPI